MDVSDEELISSIAQSDQKAMESFYHRFSSCVYQFAFKVLANPSDANEVMNEVMMEVWKKAHTFNGKSKVRTWLLSITHNKAVDTVRKKSKHDSNDDIDSAYDIASECNLELAQQGAEHTSHIKYCMNTLKNAHRQVVYLTFFEGLSYSDIAGIVDAPAGTIKTRMMHAKNQLMACLSRCMATTN